MKNIMKKLVVVTGMTILSITSFAASVNNGDRKPLTPKEQQVQEKKRLPLKKNNNEKPVRKGDKNKQQKPLKKNNKNQKNNVKKPLPPQENTRK